MNHLSKIAIVTGASRPNGIGAALCRELARKGIHIFFTYLPHYDVQTGYDDVQYDWAEIFTKELSQYGIRVGSMEIDLSTANAAALLLDEVEHTLGTPNILINNATHCEEVSYKELTTDIIAKHCAVNITGPTLLSAEFAKRIETVGFGRIVNFISGQDKSPEPGNLAYVTTKGAISAFTKTLALELAPYHITVNAVDPGPTDSGWMTQEIKSFLQPKFPTGRIGTPDDAARLVGFLVSNDARWITGQIIHSDGGFID